LLPEKDRLADGRGAFFTPRLRTTSCRSARGEKMSDMPSEDETREADDRVTAELQRAEFILRSMLFANQEVMRRLGQDLPPIERGQWEGAMPHLDQAVRELEAAFELLGIERIQFDHGDASRTMDAMEQRFEHDA
jgi:hypothetical protein